MTGPSQTPPPAAQRGASCGARSDPFAGALLDAALAAAPACRAVPASLAHAAAAHCADAVRAIAAGGPAPDPAAAGRRVAAAGERHGVAVEALTQACSAAGQTALDWLGDGLAPERYGVLAGALWGWVGAVMAAALERSRDDARLLRALLSAPHDPVALEARALAAGLDPAAEHHVVRARVARDARPGLVRGLAGQGLAAVRRDEVVALTRARPALPAGTVAGLACCRSLADLPAAHAAAGRALQTAVAFDLPGGRSLDQLGLLPAIAARPGLGARLRQRYLEPLRREGANGAAIEETLRAWLASDLQLARAAERLRLHPNTVHLRLRRFERLTDVRLDETVVRIELWWALRTEAMERGGL